MRRPQFTLRALLAAMLVVAAFCGGVKFQREWHEWRKRAAVAAALAAYEAHRPVHRRGKKLSPLERRIALTVEPLRPH
jgi:hypothetical protein